MSGFVVNPHRLDPYKIAKFQVILDGKVIPGVSKVSAIKRTTEVVEHRAGASPSHSVLAPGLSRFVPIVLTRGLTHDTTFEDWALLTQHPAGDGATSLRDLRKDLRINLLNEQGTVVLSYMLYRCWVSEYRALPALDANANAVALETLEVSYEGFERDRAVSEPVET